MLKAPVGGSGEAQPLFRGFMNSEHYAIIRHIALHVSESWYKQLEGCSFRGSRLARLVTRLHIVAALDRGLPDVQIRQVLVVSWETVRR